MPFFRSGKKKNSGGSDNPDLSYTVCYVKNGQTIPLKSSLSQVFYTNKTLNKRVVIGNNIVDCSNMFATATNFNQPIVIPDSVTNCSHMFWQANNLRYVVAIPKRAINCSHMFAYCRGEIEIPNTAQNINTLFGNNYNYPVNIPNSVIDCGYFPKGYNLNEPIIIPNSVKYCTNMFMYCGNNFNQPTVIPNSVLDCSYMFYSSKYNQPVTIPHSVKNCAGMFCNDSGLRGVYNFVIPKNVENAYRMFYKSRIGNVGDSNNHAKVYINGNPVIGEMFTNNASHLDVYCGRNMNVSSMFNSVSMSVLGDGNGYVNTKYDIYVYNNYVGT